jgi:hypothetical protein
LIFTGLFSGPVNAFDESIEQEHAMRDGGERGTSIAIEVERLAQKVVLDPSPFWERGRGEGLDGP